MRFWKELEIFFYITGIEGFFILKNSVYADFVCRFWKDLYLERDCGNIMKLVEIAKENGFKILETTKSVDEIALQKTGIPETINAAYVEKDGVVYLVKENGTKERIGTKEYWEKIGKYKPSEEHHIAKINTDIPHEKDLMSCGLCKLHKNTTALLNVVITNRCDLRCWYCFFFEEKAGFVYEPTIDEIRKGLETAKRFNGYMPPIQITGGEPALRDDVAEIIKMAREMGSPHVQLNTNSVSLGIEFFEKPEEAKARVRKWVEAGLKTVYTSFDGVKPDSNSNPKNHYETPFALEAYKQGGLKSIVLVPTVSQINLKETPEIVKFAMRNTGRGIRGVNFQPLSLVGYIKKGDREKLRVVQSDIVEELRKVFGFGMEAWYPVPTVASLADIIGREPHVHFYNNEKCGVATYVFVDGEKNKLIPITEFVDVDNFIYDISQLQTSTLKKALFGAKLIPDAIRYGGLRKALAKKLSEYIIQDELPTGERLSEILEDVIAKGDYRSLGKFHHRFLFLGMMHFQDYYNYDVNRVRRCSIHYLAGDKLIPFCTYNVFPHIHRDRYLEQHKLTGEKAKKLMEESVKIKERVESFRERKDEIVSSPIYKEVYGVS